VPNAAGPTSVFALATNPAVEVFLRRAQAAQPGFALTPADAAAVATICRQLDGLPLALELAAARVRVLPPRAMLPHLRRRLALLTGGPSDAATRQQTMRAAIGWSYDLLHPGEQVLFAQLAVLEGGGSLAAVEALSGRPAGTTLETVDQLEQLERSSLVEVAETGEGEPRFCMLETVREYALERLAATGETEQCRERHSAHFESVAAEAAGAAYSPAAASWLRRLELDHDNLRAVQRRHLERGDVDAGLRLAAALWWFWYVHGHVTEGRALLTTLLSAPGGTPHRARAESLLGLSQLAQTQGDHVVAARLLQRSVALFRQLDDPQGTCTALLAEGFVARLQEDYATAVALLEEARTLAEGIGHRFVVAASLHHLGMVAADHRQDHAAAHRLLNQSLELYRALALPRFVALVLLSLGDVALAEGQIDLARELLHDSLATMEAAGEELGIHGALDSLARLAAADHHPGRAVRLAGAAQHLRTLHGTRSWPTTERARVGWLNVARTELGDSAYETTWLAGLSMTREAAVTQALNGTAEDSPQHRDD
jgi:tetratricopeptide (TPR) repeat protein